MERCVVIAVIGAGPIGIYISSLLLKKGYSVVLFEAGRLGSESDYLNRDRYSFITPSAIPANVHRVGGGANYWMNRVSEFIETDFKVISSRPNVSWPVSHNEMKNYYRRLEADLSLEISEEEIISDYTHNLARLGLSELIVRPFRYLRAGFFLDMLDDLAQNPNFLLLEEHYCISLDNSSDGKANMHFRAPIGSVVKVADAVVLACGALQTPSLVARSLKNIGQVSNSLGTGLMEHIEGYVGTLRTSRNKSSALEKITLTRNRKLAAKDFGIGLSLSKNISEQNGLPNFQIEIVPFIPNYRILNYFSNLSAKTMNHRVVYLLRALTIFERVVLKSFFKAYHLICRVVGFKFFSLWLKSEEFPYSDSLAEFDFDSDKTVYAHKISSSTQLKLKEGLRIFQKVFTDSRVGSLKFNPRLLEKNRPIYLRPNWHPMGSMSMNCSSDNSLVGFNQNLKHFRNVYLCDSSVFPTGSNSNPVYTSLALAVRLSDFIDKALDSNS